MCFLCLKFLLSYSRLNMTVPPVVDYGRMERLKPPENTVIPLNMNTLCLFLIIVTVIGLYKRHVDISQDRERRRI